MADESTLMEYTEYIQKYQESVNQDKCVQSAFLAMGLAAWVFFVEVSMSISLYHMRLKLLISYQNYRNSMFPNNYCNDVKFSVNKDSNSYT